MALDCDESSCGCSIDGQWGCIDKIAIDLGERNGKPWWTTTN